MYKPVVEAIEQLLELIRDDEETTDKTIAQLVVERDKHNPRQFMAFARMAYNGRYFKYAMYFDNEGFMMADGF